MQNSSCSRHLLRAAAVLLLGLAPVGCGLEDPSVPTAPTGPSGSANAVTLTASPSSVPRDGRTVSTVTLVATDTTGGPLANQRFTLSVSPSDASISQTEVVTNSAGRATFTVTAPPATSGANEVLVTATPVGGVNDGVARPLAIALTGTPVGSVPAPTVTFSVSPASPVRNQQATFTATATPAEGRRITQYAWNFGDGTTATTTLPTVTKTYTSGGTFTVTVTVTDDLGQTGSASASITVTSGESAAPTVTAPVVTPASPVVEQQASFSTTATPATGRTIQTFAWNFGDGTTKTTGTPNTTHTFDDPGNHVVTVTATDDLGRSASASTSVTVTTGVTADIVFSPTDPTVGQTVRMDPRSSTIPPGISVDEYQWDFGCVLNSTCTKETQVTTPDNPVATTSYTSARTYTVRLTIVDSEGRETTTTETISID